MARGALVETYLLSLVAAVFFGLGPVFAKRGLAAGGTWMDNLLVVLATRTALFWVGLLALAGTRAFEGVTPFVAAVFALGGILASGMGRLTFYVGIDRVGSSVASAFANTRPLFAVALAVAWLGETVTPGMGIGVLVLVGGLVLLSLSRGGDIAGWRRADLVFPLLAAVAFAAGNVVRRFGFTAAPVGPLQAITVGESVALALVVGVALGSDRFTVGGLPPAARRYFLVSGALAGAGLLSMFAALRVGPVSVVDPVAATAPLFTVLFAGVLLRGLERITRGLLVGVLLVVVGVVALTVATP